MTKKSLTLGSLFDGSSGFPLGGVLAGVTPVWASEIAPFPIRVSTRRFPDMKHYGDISQMDGGKIEPVDIITFGSPCTNLSCAGRREGINGPQSRLFFEAIRVIKEMRCATNGRYPRWICWENVFGAFQSNQGRDFQKVLEEIIGICEPGTEVPMPEKNRWPYADIYMGDGWSVAYRTVDAQHWGTPQRRRRIYLVGDLAGQRAGQVLFESEGLSGYSAEGFRAWQRAAGGPPAGPGAAGIGFDCYNGTLTYDVAHTLTAASGAGGDRMPRIFEENVVLNDQGGSRMEVSIGVTGTLRAQMDGHPPCVLAAGFCKEPSAQSRSIGYEDECAPTLRAGAVPAAVALESHPMDGRIKIEESGSVQTLTTRMGTGGMNVPLLMNPKTYAVTTGNYTQVSEEQAPTLMARDYKDPAAINHGYRVRRLTPTECALCQGFPAWWCSDLDTPDPTEEDIAFWTDVWETHRKVMGTASRPKSRNQIIKWLQHPHSDAAEYAMWGNGVYLGNVFFVLAGIVWAAQMDGG